jgi:hypothetical protein
MELKTIPRLVSLAIRRGVTVTGNEAESWCDSTVMGNELGLRRARDGRQREERAMAAQVAMAMWQFSLFLAMVSGST